MESLFSFKGRVDIRSFQSFFVAAVVISFFNSFIFQLSRDTNTFWFILGMVVSVAFTAILVIMAVKRHYRYAIGFKRNQPRLAIYFLHLRTFPF